MTFSVSVTEVVTVSAGFIGGILAVVWVSVFVSAEGGDVPSPDDGSVTGAVVETVKIAVVGDVTETAVLSGGSVFVGTVVAEVSDETGAAVCAVLVSEDVSVSVRLDSAFAVIKTSDVLSSAGGYIVEIAGSVTTESLSII